MPKFSFIKVKSPRQKSTQDKKKKSTEEKGANKPPNTSSASPAMTEGHSECPSNFSLHNLALGNVTGSQGRYRVACCLAASQERD